jgi:hypothetical protein
MGESERRTGHNDPVCENCKFWEESAMNCRRYPPTIIANKAYPEIDDDPLTSEFPISVSDDWCGEFSPAPWCEL